MDIGTIKKDMLTLRQQLKSAHIHPDVIILFGSQADGRARPDSDIDVAIISRNYGVNRLQESSSLNLLASRLNPAYEMVPISLKSYLDPDAASPLLHEIKTKGIIIF